MRYFLLLLLGITVVCHAADLPISNLKLPPGFSIAIYASPIPDARSMALGTNGVVFVSTRTEGKIYAVVPDKSAPYGTKVMTIASGLNMPNGIAFREGSLYVADVDRVLRYDNVEANLAKLPKPVVLVSNLPNEKHHGWRYMRIGPDNKMYIAVGAPCNTCLQTDNRFATIMRMDLNGGAPEVYASGIRNSVGFDWDPATHDLVFTDNGRDWMGDDSPPDELNVATKANQHFGFPYCYGKNTHDPEYGPNHPCSAYVPAVLDLPAHVAPLGVEFYTGNMFPAEYKNQILVAEHGSWNRSTKIGYQVILVTHKNNTYTMRPFITGWLTGDSVWGRPVAFLQLPDGSLLISDDHAGVIYRVTYKK